MSDRLARLELALRTSARRRLPPSLRNAMREAALSWSPPVLLEAGRRARNEWEYIGRGPPDPSGWDVDSVALAYRDTLTGVRAAIAAGGPLGIPLEPLPSEPASGTDDSAHHLAMTFGYVLARVAAGRERLSALDWGGGGGAYGILARALLPGIEIDYAVAEVGAVAERCSSENDDVVFVTEPDWRLRTYDLVMTSNALQYAPDWVTALRNLAAVASGPVFVARLPVTVAPASFVVRQTPTRYGYDTSYSGWVVARDQLMKHSRGAGLVLEQEFLANPSPMIPGIPAPILNRSFLFGPAHGSQTQVPDLS